MTMMTQQQMKQRQAAKRREMKRRRVMRNRMILAGVVFMLAIIIGGACMIIHTSKANAAAEEEYEYIPTHTGVFVQFSHTVKGGESLGTIAANYIRNYDSDETVDDVVNNIINFTGLDRTEATYHLQAGQKIIVPLWISEDRNPHHNDADHSCTEESQNN